MLYQWRSESDNENNVTLSFADDNASFTAENDSFTLSVSGYCAVYDDHFIISDTRAKDNYTFRYHLYGDHIDLTYGDGTITLQKIKD